MFRWLLLPFSFLYALIVWLRNRLFDVRLLPSKEFDVPVIVVGNITVGGTGKTPHVEYILKLLHNKKKTAVLSRGYKRTSKGFVVADFETNSKKIGDEPRQIKRKFPDVGVAVDAHRVNGITKLLKGAAGFDPEVIVLDDAYQHRYVKPGLSILLVDYNSPLEKDYILPYGRLRESVSEKKRANIVIVTKAPANLKPIDRRLITTEMGLFPYQSLFFSYLTYGEPQFVFPQPDMKGILNNGKKNFDVLLVTGIANPIPLKEHLESLFNCVEHIRFADHHAFTGKDVKKIDRAFNAMDSDNKFIITTEKDAVRMCDNSEFEGLSSVLYYVPIEVEFLNNDSEVFHNKIDTFIANSKKIASINRTL